MKLYTQEQVIDILMKFSQERTFLRKGIVKLWAKDFFKNTSFQEYPYSHIYETMGGKYGLSSYNEHDQIDGIFDTFQEAVDFGLSQLKQK